MEQLSMFEEYFISRWEIPFKLTQISGNLIEGLSKTFIPLKLHSIGLIRFNILENWTYRYNLEAPILYYIAPHWYIPPGPGRHDGDEGKYIFNEFCKSFYIAVREIFSKRANSDFILFLSLSMMVGQG